MSVVLTPRPPRIAALWFGIQCVWSALLGVWLQGRVVELAPQGAVAAYAWLATGGAVVAALVQLAAGFASDRQLARSGSRNAFYVGGVAVAAVALLGFFAAPSLTGLVVAFLALQLGMNVVGGPYQAAIPDAIELEASGRASAWMSAYSFAGNVVGLIVAIALHGLAAGATLTALLIGSAAVTLTHTARLAPSMQRATPLRFDRAAAIVLASRAAINLGFYTLVGFLFFFVRESLGVADARTTTGVLFIAFTLAGVVGAGLAGGPSDRYDKRVVIGAAAGAIALAIGALAAAPGVAVAAAAAIAAGLAWGGFVTVDWSIAYAVLPRAAMATAMGVWNLAATVPQILAPALTAPLIAAVDARAFGAGPRVALLAAGAEFVVGALALWAVPAARIARVPLPESQMRPL